MKEKSVRHDQPRPPQVLLIGEEFPPTLGDRCKW